MKKYAIALLVIMPSLAFANDYPATFSEALGNVLPKDVCNKAIKKPKLFQTQMKHGSCLKLATKATQQCLARYKNIIPNYPSSLEHRKLYGGMVGLCVGNFIYSHKHHTQTNKFLTQYEYQASGMWLTNKKPQDKKPALDLLKVSADHGNADAQLALGNFYFKGSFGLKKNYKEALHYMKLAVKNGNKDALNNLAVIYADESPPNHKKTFELYKKAAKNGDSFAMYNVGLYYEKGLGVKQNYQQALVWLNKSVKFSNSCPANDLGYLYAIGHGVTKNPEQAKKWFNKAVLFAYKNHDLSFINNSKVEAKNYASYMVTGKPDNKLNKRIKQAFVKLCWS